MNYEEAHVCCHILACIIINAEGSVFSCELSGTGEGVGIPKKPRMSTVCCTLVCINAEGSVFSSVVTMYTQ